jgi:hypothetical protein
MRIGILTIICLFSVLSCTGQKTWTGLGANFLWSNANNWNPVGIPVAGEDVTIAQVTASALTVEVDVAAVCSNLAIENSSVANVTVKVISSNSLSVSNIVTLDNSAATASANSILDLNNGTLTCSAIQYIESTDDTRDCSFRIGSGTATVTGNIVMGTTTARSDLSFYDNATLNIGGTISGGTLNAPSGTINYNFAGDQNIAAYNYNNLSTSGSGVKSIDNNITVNGDLTIGAVTSLQLGVTKIAGNIYGNLSVLGNTTNNGTFIIKSDATGTGSFIDNGNFTNAGNIQVERYLYGCDCLYNFHYISSPVEKEAISIFDPVYYYKENHGSYFMSYGWNKISAGNFATMKGYSVKVAGANTLISFTAGATETLNTGTISIPVSYSPTTATSMYEGWNLVGNPYPSTVDWEQVKLDGGLSNMNDEIHFWNGANYSDYVSGAGTNGGTRFIPEMQGFFVKAQPGGGLLTLKNTARVHNHGLYYGGFWKKTGEISNILKLKLSQGNKSDETIIRFKEGASFETDNFDAHKLLVEKAEFPQVYSLTPGKELLSINSNPGFTGTLIIPLQMEIAQIGNHTISVCELGILDTVMVYLQDTEKNQSILLGNNTKYDFTASKTGTMQGFNLLFRKKVNGQEQPQANELKLFSAGNKIHFMMPQEMANNDLLNISIFDLPGRCVRNYKHSHEPEFTLQTELSEGFYIVNIQANGISFSKKIFLTPNK